MGGWEGCRAEKCPQSWGNGKSGVGVLGSEGIGRAFFPIWKDLPPRPWTARHLGSKLLNLSPPALSGFCHPHNVQINRQAPSRETRSNRFVWEIVPTSFPYVLGGSLLQLDTQQTHSLLPTLPDRRTSARAILC